MKISVIGNPDLAFDYLPFQMMPQLQKDFPGIQFVPEDPNELDLPTDDIIFLDTVKGLKKVRVIDVEEIAKTAARATAHDFDLTSHILLTKKVNPNIHILIIGVPMGYAEEDAYKEVKEEIQKLQK